MKTSFEPEDEKVQHTIKETYEKMTLASRSELDAHWFRLPGYIDMTEVHDFYAFTEPGRTLGAEFDEYMHGYRGLLDLEAAASVAAEIAADLERDSSQAA